MRGRLIVFENDLAGVALAIVEGGGEGAGMMNCSMKATMVGGKVTLMPSAEVALSAELS